MTIKQKREYIREGRAFSFNFTELENWNKRQKHGTQANLIRILEQKGIASRSAFFAWLRGENAPSDVEIVSKLENLLSLPPDALLLEKNNISTTEDTNMNARNIEGFERDAARTIYKKMCDMIRGLEYLDPDRWLMSGIPLTQDGFRYLGNQTHPFEYRDGLIQEIRKAGFDFPKQMRNQLISFVRNAFGDGCYETGMMYFESEEYKSYLKRNELDDTADIRELYSDAYIEDLYKKLDEIFREYLS